ncbi:unnamed protein product [Rangifer tarandus platyrhynchus]|uniref:Uncharacterized protein n=1 Tax=Rangifer tarandus platyrhynchus TaxID=3082113 RepID=A0ABN8ZMU1_RANTA|nr:unnamed protein product [Rangifer tarandus platyrhynchus]
MVVLLERGSHSGFSGGGGLAWQPEASWRQAIPSLHEAQAPPAAVHTEAGRVALHECAGWALCKRPEAIRAVALRTPGIFLNLESEPLLKSWLKPGAMRPPLPTPRDEAGLLCPHPAPRGSQPESQLRPELRAPAASALPVGASVTPCRHLLVPEISFPPRVLASWSAGSVTVHLTDVWRRQQSGRAWAPGFAGEGTKAWG